MSAGIANGEQRGPQGSSIVSLGRQVLRGGPGANGPGAHVLKGPGPAAKYLLGTQYAGAAVV